MSELRPDKNPLTQPASGPAPLPYRGHGDHCAPPGKSYNSIAIVGFILALSFPPLGLIFSWVAIKGIRKSGNPDGQAFATAGLVISVIWMALASVWLTIIFTLLTGSRH